MNARRPPMPQYVKYLVWDREKCACVDCRLVVEHFDQAEFEHRPALWVRERNQNFEPSNPRHYLPNANDPAFIFVIHGKKSGRNCHDLRTFGNGLDRGDVSNAAKTKRIIAKRAETSRGGYALIEKAPGGPPQAKPKSKSKIASRPFPKGQRKLQGRPFQRSRGT